MHPCIAALFCMLSAVRNSRVGCVAVAKFAHLSVAGPPKGRLGVWYAWSSWSSVGSGAVMSYHDAPLKVKAPGGRLDQDMGSLYKSRGALGIVNA